MSSRFKVGDKVLVKNNSHYPKPIRIVKVLEPNGMNKVFRYCLRGAKSVHIHRNKYLEFTEDELLPQEIWDSPLYKLMSEK